MSQIRIGRGAAALQPAVQDVRKPHMFIAGQLCPWSLVLPPLSAPSADRRPTVASQMISGYSRGILVYSPHLAEEGVEMSGLPPPPKLLPDVGRRAGTDTSANAGS